MTERATGRDEDLEFAEKQVWGSIHWVGLVDSRERSADALRNLLRLAVEARDERDRLDHALQAAMDWGNGQEARAVVDELEIAASRADTDALTAENVRLKARLAELEEKS